MSTKWIYVGIEEALLTLPEAERRVREVALSAMRDAGITAPDIEASASPRVVIDEDEEVVRSVRVTLRFPGGSRDQTIDIEDVVTKVRAAFLAAGFDAGVEPDSN